MSRTFRFNRGMQYLKWAIQTKSWLKNGWWTEEDYLKHIKESLKFLNDRNKEYGESKTLYEKVGKRKARTQERILTTQIMKDPELFDDAIYYTKREVVNPWDYS